MRQNRELKKEQAFVASELKKSSLSRSQAPGDSAASKSEVANSSFSSGSSSDSGFRVMPHYNDDE